MIRTIRCCLFIVLVITAGSCYEEQEIPVLIDFEYSIASGSYTVPVELSITNRTTGADFYLWSFEGASPASGSDKQPGVIRYDKAGTYTIALEAWNDTQRERKEITIRLDSAVSVGFRADVLVNDFAPVTAALTNHTTGATSYAWKFEGGIPETSEEAHPGPVLFNAPGEHLITLTVFNGREYFTSTQTIIVKEALLPDFDIVPSFEDEDYEAPLKATLLNRTVSGLRYSWTAPGGAIADGRAETTDIFFANPGDYTVTLSVENDKEAKTVQRTIHVKPNTNLYTMTDIKLGVSAAHATIGCFYSTTLRRVLKRDDVTEENGKSVDLVFYAVNSSFGYCRFLSPDSAGWYTFRHIPGRTHTSIINTQETGPVRLSAEQFEAMTDDSLLAGLDVAANDTKTNYFIDTPAPRIVLFRTADGRIGAVHVREFVSNGAQSYVLVDIKVQKLKS